MIVETKKGEIATKLTRTNEKLKAEVEELRLRLEEAEETLRAIQNNEVDALVIDGPQGQQVFTLRGAEQPYRILMETMSEGALTIAMDGTILYCNSHLSDMIGMPLNKILGEPFHGLIMQENGQSLKAMLQVCGKEACRGEFLLKTADGKKVPVSLSARSLMLNDVEAFCIVATDLTDQKHLQEAIEKDRDRFEEKVAERTSELWRANAALQKEITERRQIEEQLRQSEERFRFALKDTPVSVAIQDCNLVYQWAYNQKPRQSDEIVGKTDADLFPEDASRIIEDKLRVLESGAEVHVEHWLTSNGSRLFLEAHYGPMRDSAGKITGIGITAVDRTEQKRAEEALSASEERFRAAFDSSAVPMSITAPDGILIKVNAAFCRMMGYSEAELLTLTFYRFTHPDDLGENRAGVQEMLEGKRASFHMEKRYVRKDGRVIWGDMSTTAVRDADGFPLYMVTHVQDITERKEAEEELRLAAETFEKTFHGNSAAMALSRTRDGYILDVNNRWLALTGFRREEVIGKTAVELRLWKDPEDRDAIIRDVEHHGSVLDRECVVLRKNGQEWTALFYAQTITLQGEQVLISSAVDITERKQAEEELEAARREAENEKRRLEIVMETLPVGVAIVDIKGGSIMGNHAFEQIWGSPLPEVDSVADYTAFKAWWADTGKPVEPEEWASARAVNNGETIIGQLMEIERFDGSHVFIHNSAAPIFGTGGQMLAAWWPLWI